MPRPTANVYPAASGGSNAAKLARVCRQREKAEADRQAAEVRRRCVASLKDGVSKECRTSCTDASKQRRCSVQREILRGADGRDCRRAVGGVRAETGSMPRGGWSERQHAGGLREQVREPGLRQAVPVGAVLGRAFAGAIVCRRRRAMYRRSRSSWFLLSSLVAFAACSTVRHSELRRGPLVRKVQVDERVEDRDAVTVVEGGVAQVWVKRKTCTHLLARVCADRAPGHHARALRRDDCQRCRRDRRRGNPRVRGLQHSRRHPDDARVGRDGRHDWRRHPGPLSRHRQ